MRRRSAFVATLTGGVALVACQVVAGIEPVEKIERVDGSDVPDSAPDVVDPCIHASPPPEPVEDDDPDAELPPFYLAFRTIDVVAKDEGGYLGFDLDGVCTCDDRPGTASGGASSCTPKLKDCDGDGGVDNGAAPLFERFAPSGLSPGDSATKGITSGKRGLLLYVKGYNGKPNDRGISVGVMLSHGIVDGSGCGTSTGGERSPPGWCGKDLWTYSLEHVKPASKEPLVLVTGYVNQGTLVFRSDLPITAFFGTATVSIGGPIAAGVLEKNAAGNWTLRGRLGGRIPVTELLAAAGTFKGPGDSESDARLCTSPLFTTLKKMLCEAVDIRRTSARDFEDGACDALSTTLTFTAEQSMVGEEKTELAENTACSPGKVAPDLYMCP